MADKQKVLIVDDDENIAELISLYLLKECYETKIASDGQEALDFFKSFGPDIMLLDIMLPVKDGYQVLSEIRKVSSCPVIMLSAKGETFDKVLGLELGADDYMVKPFDSKELVARVKAVLRRAPAKAVPDDTTEKTEGVVRFPGLLININDYTVTYENRRIEMPPKELELVYCLAKAPDRVFTREQLLESIWGYEYLGDTRTVDVHIKRIREKLPENAHWAISTVWGVGYKFEVMK